MNVKRHCTKKKRQTKSDRKFATLLTALGSRTSEGDYWFYYSDRRAIQLQPFRPVLEGVDIIVPKLKLSLTSEAAHTKTNQDSLCLVVTGDELNNQTDN